MLVSKQCANSIIRSFPKHFELCNERIIHNKVPEHDFYRIVPKGRKCFIWFKKYNDSVYVYLIEYNKYRKRLTKVYNMSACFSKDLTIGRYGTICYGTLFKCDNIKYFTIEDVLYYKSDYICDESWNIKLKTFYSIMKETRQNIYATNVIISQTEFDFRIELFNEKFQVEDGWAYHSDGLIILTPEAAKKLLIDLQKNISSFEKEKGEIKTSEERMKLQYYI